MKFSNIILCSSHVTLLHYWFISFTQGFVQTLSTLVSDIILFSSVTIYFSTGLSASLKVLFKLFQPWFMEFSYTTHFSSPNMLLYFNSGLIYHAASLTCKVLFQLFQKHFWSSLTSNILVLLSLCFSTGLSVSLRTLL